MINKSKKSNLVIAIVLFMIAAVFLAYGIYMVDYSIDYVQTYMEISTISPDTAFQYVVSSSAIYIGFAIVIFIGGAIIFLLGKPRNMIHEIKESKKAASEKAAIEDNTETDAHPENNPYYTAPVHVEDDHETKAKSNPAPEKISYSEFTPITINEPISAPVKPEEETEKAQTPEPVADEKAELKPERESEHQQTPKPELELELEFEPERESESEAQSEADQDFQQEKESNHEQKPEHEHEPESEPELQPVKKHEQKKEPEPNGLEPSRKSEQKQSADAERKTEFESKPELQQEQKEQKKISSASHTYEAISSSMIRDIFENR